MGNYDKKMEYLTLLCNRLNEAGIKNRTGFDKNGEPKFEDWFPSVDVFYAFISNVNIFNYLKSNGLINTGICPNCGEYPIDSTFTFTSGFNPSIKYNICKSCHESGRKISNNPANESKGCYIATVCYGDPLATEVIFFKRYRDLNLNKSILGRAFINTYYFFSPKISIWLKNKKKLNKFIKLVILDNFYKQLYKKNPNY